MIEKIQKIIAIPANKYKKELFNIHNHYVIKTNRGLLYPLTSNRISYWNIENIKISDNNVAGQAYPQYMIPIGHEYDERYMRVFLNKEGTAYLAKHRDALQKVIDENKEITLANINDYLIIENE